MDLTALKRDLDGIKIEDHPAIVQQKSRDFYWYSPVLKRELDHVKGDADRLAEERGGGDPRARRLPPPRRSGDAARQRHRQLRAGDAAVRRRGAEPRRHERGDVDRAGPRRHRSGRGARRHRPSDARAFRPGTEDVAVDLQHGVDRRLRRRRFGRRRLDPLGRPARPRQRHPAARSSPWRPSRR